MLPRMLPSQKHGSILLGSVHYLLNSLCQYLEQLTDSLRLTQNHMEAPRAVAVYRYMGRTCQLQTVSFREYLLGGVLLSAPSRTVVVQDGRELDGSQACRLPPIVSALQESQLGHWR